MRILKRKGINRFEYKTTRPAARGNARQVFGEGNGEVNLVSRNQTTFVFDVGENCQVIPRQTNEVHDTT